MKDLEPYVCTFPECERYDLIYGDREEWFEHESHHRQVYHCGERHHEQFADEAQFRHHMAHHHKLAIELTRNSASLSIFLRPTDHRAAVKCQLCGNTTSRLKNHLSHHLERIALFAIPKIHKMEETSQIGDDELSVVLLNGSRIHKSGSSSKGLESVLDSDTLSSESIDARNQEVDVLGESGGEVQITEENTFGDSVVTVPDTDDVSWYHIKPELRAASPPSSKALALEAQDYGKIKLFSFDYFLSFGGQSRIVVLYINFMLRFIILMMTSERRSAEQSGMESVGSTPSLGRQPWNTLENRGNVSYQASQQNIYGNVIVQSV